MLHDLNIEWYTVAYLLIKYVSIRFQSHTYIFVECYVICLLFGEFICTKITLNFSFIVQIARTKWAQMVRGWWKKGSEWRNQQLTMLLNLILWLLISKCLKATIYINCDQNTMLLASKLEIFIWILNDLNRKWHL